MNADKGRALLEAPRRNPFWVCFTVFLLLACDYGFRLPKLLDQREVNAIQASNAETDEKTKNREENPRIVRRKGQDAGGDREVDHRHEENFAAANLIREPAIKYGSEHGAKP